MRKYTTSNQSEVKQYGKNYLGFTFNQTTSAGYTLIDEIVKIILQHETSN